MKSLADVKRRVAAGARLEVVEQTKRPVLVGTTRTVTRSTSARWYFTTDAEGFDDGTELDQPWPRARDTRIIDADTFEYDLPHPAKGHVIRLRFLPDAGTALLLLDSGQVHALGWPYQHEPKGRQPDVIIRGRDRAH